MRDRVGRNPRPLIIIVVALALIGGFFAVVAPLFNTSGAATADLGGVLPTQAVAGRPLEIDLGYDNTGNSVISPTCVQVTIQGPMRATNVVFQGVDTEPFKNGESCGGSLNGQETVSLVITLQPTAAGVATVTIAPAQGTTAVGAGFGGRITIAAA